MNINFLSKVICRKRTSNFLESLEHSFKQHSLGLPCAEQVTANATLNVENFIDSQNNFHEAEGYQFIIDTQGGH